MGFIANPLGPKREEDIFLAFQINPQGELVAGIIPAVNRVVHDNVIKASAGTIGRLDPRSIFMGSGNNPKRLKRLTAQGVDPEVLKRIHALVGLNLGASTPEEIALAVLAEIIQVWHQRE